jgi:hypothetical protein
MKRVSLFVLTILLLLSIRSDTAIAADPVRDGWWIRINTNQTQATSIDFQIGTKAQDRETWRTWHSNDPVEFDVPAKYRSVEHIYIRATANPEGRRAWFCLMYAGKGVKHFDTDNWQQEDRSQNDSDDDCK